MIKLHVVSPRQDRSTVSVTLFSVTLKNSPRIDKKKLSIKTVTRCKLAFIAFALHHSGEIGTGHDAHAHQKERVDCTPNGGDRSG